MVLEVGKLFPLAPPRLHHPLCSFCIVQLQETGRVIAGAQTKSPKEFNTPRKQSNQHHTHPDWLFYLHFLLTVDVFIGTWSLFLFLLTLIMTEAANNLGMKETLPLLLKF
jgi:hypothetical protein